MSAVINGDTVIFKNRYGLQDIVLKHQDDAEGYRLVFNSGVVFKQGLDQLTIEFDGMSISRDNEKMVFKRGESTLMILE